MRRKRSPGNTLVPSTLVESKMDLKPFDSADWELWSGAERFPDLMDPEDPSSSFPPLIAYGVVKDMPGYTYTAVGDATGLSIYLVDPDGEIIRMWSRSGTMREVGRLAGFLEGPLDRDTLSLLRFESTYMGDVGYGPTGLS